MPKRIIAQRRGKGSPTYRAPSHRFKTQAKIPWTGMNTLRGVLLDIAHDPSKTAPVGIVKYENGEYGTMIVAEGMKTGQEVEVGPKTSLREGNTMALGNIPEGTPVFNIELKPGDGGKLVRSSGAYAVILSQDEGKTIVRLPSKALKALNPKCRATIGIVAGGERIVKPLGKAGKKHHKMRARGKLYPRTSGSKMNPVDHPFGGSTRPGKPKTVKRTAPPGRKVGSIAARRTGRRKGSAAKRA